jgi:hypothetical protein
MAESTSTSITASTVAARRLQSLGLAAPTGEDHAPFTEPVEVVRHHLAMQAQDWRASQWAIGSRMTPGATSADVLAAYDRGEIVRSWPMRGTVHVAAAQDMPWMLDLLGTRALRGVERRWEYLGISERVLEPAREVALQLLGGGRAASRAEFVEAIEQAGIDLGGQRAYHTVWYLAQTGTLVQGPTRDGEQLLVLLDDWIPKPRRFADRDDALAELGRRYLRAHAPARVEDLMWWSSLGKRDCRAAFEAAADEFVPVRMRDQELWVRREHAGEPAKLRSTMLALPAFDEHLLGYRVRDEVLDPAHAHLVDPGRNGVFRWTLVDRGRVVATWSRRRLTRSIVVDVSPFDALPPARRSAAVRAIERWGAFVGTPVDVRLPDAD